MDESEIYIPTEMDIGGDNQNSQQYNNIIWRAKFGGFSGSAIGVVTSTLSEALNAAEGEKFKMIHVVQGIAICGVVGSVVASCLPSLYDIPPLSIRSRNNSGSSNTLLSAEEGYASTVAYERQNNDSSKRELN